MIKVGEYNELKIARKTPVGLFLSDEQGEEVLLPNKFCLRTFEIGQQLSVFILNDSEDRLIATTSIPKIVVNEFALLKVTAVTQVGAFMDWGMEKELMVPFSEQKEDMEEDRWYVVYMGLDHETNRLYGSSKVQRFLQNQMLSVKEGEKVSILVYKKTDLGYSVIINDEHMGLVFENEVFKPLNVGDKLKAYVKHIRSDNKIDITLQPIGYENFISKNSEEVYRVLEQHKGEFPISDKSSPELIYSKFQMSKKAFKKALGDLYKQRKITISSDGIHIVKNE